MGAQSAPGGPGGPGPNTPGQGPSTTPLTPGQAITFVTPGGTITITLNAGGNVNVPGGQDIQVVYTPNPTGDGGNPLNPVQQGSLGGGNVNPQGGPVDIKLVLHNNATGLNTPVGSDLGGNTTQVTLPVLGGGDFEWLMAVYDPTGGFLGYVRLPSVFNADGTKTYTISFSQLQGTLFLPAQIVKSYVRNFDPNIHIYSGYSADAVDFGVAGPQFTLFTVVAPQVGSRLFVYNEQTKNYGWIGVNGVGPVGAP